MKIPTIHVPGSRMFAGVAIGMLVGVLAVGVVSAAGTSAVGTSGVGISGVGISGVGSSGAASVPAGQLGVPAARGARDSVAAAALGGLDLGGGALRRVALRNFRLDVIATGQDGIRTFLYVRGSLDVSPTSVTVTLPNGSTQTFTVDASTVVREDGTTVPYSDLADGSRAMVFGRKNDDGSYTATLIRCVREPKAGAAPTAP